MKWTSIALRGLGPFGDAALDLAALPPGLVAVTGENGAGKSVLLELLAGALYRQTPTRGSLAELATARDAFVEVGIDIGKRYTIRQQIDGTSGKGEALVLDEAGQPVLHDGKVRTFDHWAAEHLPSPEVLYSSAFSSQGSGGFLELKAGERKAVLLRVLGVEHLEGLAEAARKRAATAKGEMSVASARLADEEARGGSVAHAETDLAAHRARLEAAEHDLALKRAAFAVLERQADAARAAQREAAAVEARRAELQAGIEAAAARQRDLGARIANNRALLGQAAEVRDAVARTAEIDLELARLGAEQKASEQAALDAKNEQILAQSRIDRADARERQANRRVAELEGVAAGLSAAEAAAAGLPALREALALAESAEAAARETNDRIGAERLAGAEERIGGLRGSLDQIRIDARHGATAADLGEIASDGLARDDDAIEEAAAAPERRRAAMAAVLCAAKATTAARAALADAERASAGLEPAKRARTGLDVAKADVVAARDEKGEGIGAWNSKFAESKRLIDESDKRVVAMMKLRSEHAVLAPLARLADRLAQAEARLAELEPQAEDAVAEQSRLSNELEALPALAPAPPAPPVEAGRHAVLLAETEARSAAARLALAERGLEDARASEAKRATLKGEAAAAAAELADWTRLGEDLGRSGLQALEVDAAGPELTTLCNDLLFTCCGSRWTVSIETQRLSADGKRTIEGCEVRVLDCEKGRDATAESLSGGERVLVGEALSLALSMLACRRSGFGGGDLIRDETGAALDPGRGRAYVAMLRRAAQIVGARHVLYVSHTPELQELADARIVVANGTATVQP